MPPRTSVVAYIGIGSNLDRPKQQVEQACHAIDLEENINLEAVSHWYTNAAIGPEDQPDYVNGVARITTALEPHALLDRLQAIENRQGRERTVRWGARTLDLDILLYGNEQIITERLKVPHVEMGNRNFVITPLADLDPSLVIPAGPFKGSAISELMHNLSDHTLTRI